MTTEQDDEGVGATGASEDQETEQQPTPESLLNDSRRLEKISKVGEHTVFPPNVVRVGAWEDLPTDLSHTPHIVRGPFNICGPNLIALRFEDNGGYIYFPVPTLIANLLGAAYDKGARTALAQARRALGIRF